MKASLLIINPEYSESVPPLTTEEYNGIKHSIESQGQYLPIIVNKNFEILDGHHRFKICQELGIEPEYEIKEFPTLAHEQLFVINCNLKRRHLPDFVKGLLALKSKPILEKIARSNSQANLKQNNGENDSPTGKYLPLGRVNEQIGEQVKLSRDTIRKIEFIQNNAAEEVKQKLCQGKSSINKEYKKIWVYQKRQEFVNEAAKVELSNNNNCQLHNQDFRDIGPDIIPDNSIDLIFTDPPYCMDNLDLYSELGVFANRVLKEGGSLVTFTAQYALSKILNSVESGGLNQKWIICVKHTGHYAKMRGFGTQISVAWKPLLLFVKGDKASNLGWLVDYVESEPPDKEAHDWQQSTVEAEHVIKGLTVENQIIVDPFMGSGTTGISALSLNRKFVGIEIDKERFEIARAKINSVNKKWK